MSSVRSWTQSAGFVEHSQVMPVQVPRRAARTCRSRWLQIVAVAVSLSLWPLSSSGAIEPISVDAVAETHNEAEPDSRPGGVQVVRYAGSDPYALSIEVAQALVDSSGGSSEWVVLASGEHWAHAAVAGPLAASLGAPVVLAPPGGLQTSAARPDLAEFLRSAGVRRAVIVGDPEALPNHEPSVLFGLGMLPRNIERAHSDDPVGTSIAVADRIGAPAEFGELGRTVIIASGQSIADAVAVGPLAAAGPFPLLLTAPDALDPRIAAYLAEHEVAHVVLVGGTAAITPAVQTAVETAGITVARLAGRDRADTARLAADLFEQHTGDDPTCADATSRIGLAPARQPEQALTAGPLLAHTHTCTPLRYTEPDHLPADVRNTLYLARNASPGAAVAVFGSPRHIADRTLDVQTPPVRFAAFNYRPNADASALVGVLQVIDERGALRSYPETEVTIPREQGIPPNWWQRSWLDVSHKPRISWSPDGRLLAFWGADASELYVLDTRASQLRRIAVVDAPLDGYPSPLNWSPDGSRLAFSAIVRDESTLSDPSQTLNGISEFTTELFVHDFASAETIRLTHNNFRDSVGPWSPDSSRLVYEQTPARATFMTVGYVSYRLLHVLELETRESVRLHVYVTSSVGPDQDIALWSPRSDRVAFVAIPDGALLERVAPVYVATQDGSRVQELPHSVCEDCITYPTSILLPSFIVHGWSPSGDKLAYNARYTSQKKWLVHDIATGRVLEVMRDEWGPQGGLTSDHRFIGWTPDDSALLFFHLRCSGRDFARIAQWQILQVTADGEGTLEVLDPSWQTDAQRQGCYPTFRLGPDGQSLVVADRKAGLALVRLDDESIHSLWRPTQRAPEASFRTSEECKIEWTHNGIQVGCTSSTGDY